MDEVLDAVSLNGDSEDEEFDLFEALNDDSEASESLKGDSEEIETLNDDSKLIESLNNEPETAESERTEFQRAESEEVKFQKAESDEEEAMKLSPIDAVTLEVSNQSRSPMGLPPPPLSPLPRPDPIRIPLDDECGESSVLDPCTSPRSSLLRMNSGPIPMTPLQQKEWTEAYDHDHDQEDSDGIPSNTFWELSRLLGNGFWGGSGTNVTPENIYATANISAFASSLSLLALIAGVILVMLNQERSLITTMKTSYLFMKELSEGYQAGVRELQRKTGGDVDMKQQFSEFVQAMHALPWQQLRESLDQDQLEELFRVLANVPTTIDQAQDEVWSICVTFRRIFGLSVDYCIPSPRHPPSKLLISFQGNDHTVDLIRGEYLEKGLPQSMANWHKQARDQTININPINSFGDEPDDLTLEYYQALPSMVTIEPKAFEKVNLAPNQEASIWNHFNPDLMLVNRFVIHQDPHWHVDLIQIGNIRAFSVVDSIMFNPTEITSDDPSVQILVKTIKMRDPAIDSFAEFHVFKVTEDAINAMNGGGDGGLDNMRSIEYQWDSSPFIKERDDEWRMSEAKMKRIYMERDATSEFQPRWEVRSVDPNDLNQCLFRSPMNKPLHHKTSWDVQGNGKVAPVMFIEEIEVRIAGDGRASGTYKLTTNPFQTGYFTHYDPDPHLVFVKKQDVESGETTIHRLFMTKSPDHQWYLQRYDATEKAINRCRLSLGNNEGMEPDQGVSLCTHAVPRSNWRSSEVNQVAMRSMKTKSFEFNYGDDRIYNIFLQYSREMGSRGEGSTRFVKHQNTISLQKQILIKGNDVYFKMFTKRDEHDLDQYYNQIVLDLTAFNVIENVQHFCTPQPGSTELPTVHLANYEGKVEAIGGKIESGTFIVVFYHETDCLNFVDTVTEYCQPVSFL